ncbi:MAG: PAS domain S-box protein [Thermoplasmata archaeon]
MNFQKDNIVNVLLVDDDKSFLELGRTYLMKENSLFEITTASSVEDALDVLKHRHYDVIVSDYQMPETDGLEFLRILRVEHRDNKPFIILTGKGREEVAVKALNLGADRYIQKGGKSKGLYGVVAKAIEKEVEHRRALEKVDDLNSLLMSIRNVNQLIVQEDDLLTMMKGSCKVLLEARDYLNIEIALLDEKTDIISPAASSREHGKSDWKINSEGEGDAPACIKETLLSGETIVIEEFSEFCENCPQLQNCSPHMSVLIPIVQKEQVVGILKACMVPGHILSIEEMELLKEVADDLGFARDKIMTEKRLEQERSQFLSIFDSIDEPIYVSDPETYEILYVNKACREAFDDELVGKICYEEFQDLDSPCDFCTNDVILARKGRAYHWEHHNPALNKDFMLVDRIIRWPDGRDVRFEMAIDITDRKKAEKALKESEERYRGLVETSFAGISITDFDERLTFVNDRFAEMLGYEKEELLGKNLDDVSPEDQHEVYRTETKKRQRGMVSSYESRLKKKDGGMIYVKIYANPLRDPEGEFMGTLGVVTDISDLKAAQTAVKKSEETLKKLYDASSVVEGMDDIEELYDRAVEIAKIILNFDACSILLEEQGRLMVKASTEKELLEKILVPLDRWIAGKVYLENQSKLIYDLREEDCAKPLDSRLKSGLYIPIGDVGVFQAHSYEKNCYDKKDLEIAELFVSHVKEAVNRIKTEERQSTLHSLLRHDIKNKAHIIQGYLELIGEYELSDEAERFIDKALKANRDSVNLIDKVGLLIKVNEETVDRVDIALEIREAADSMSKYAESKDMDILLDCSMDTCMVKAGPLVKEIFYNMIENAVRHSEGGTVKISLKKEDDKAICTIEDDGKGIPEDKRSSVFERGFTTGGGTGLGLFLVKVLIEGYGGSIELLDSRRGGAKFDVVFIID